MGRVLQNEQTQCHAQCIASWLSLYTVTHTHTRVYQLRELDLNSIVVLGPESDQIHVVYVKYWASIVKTTVIYVL